MSNLAMLMTCPKCGSTTLGGHVCGILDNSPGLNVVPRPQVEAERAVNRLRRARTLSGTSVYVSWAFPGFDSRLRLEVDEDRFGTRRLLDVLDEQGRQFPYTELELNGKSLEDVLLDYLENLPDLEGA